MNKPGSLRAALVAAIPTLAAEPDKLAVFVDQGSVEATGGRSLSFDYRYVVNVLLLDFAGDCDAVMIALLDWARGSQQDLLTNADERRDGITFEVDLLNDDTCDLSVKVRVSESVVVNEEDRHVVASVDESVQTWGAR